MVPDKQIILDAERIEMESMKALCLPYKYRLPPDGNIYFYEFSTDCVIFISASDALFGNRVLGAGIQTEISGNFLREIIEFFRKAGSKRFFIQICPLLMNETAREDLAWNGFSHYNNWVKLARSTADIHPLELDTAIEVRSGNKKDAGEISELIIRSFAMLPELKTFCKGIFYKPGWTNFTAILDDKIAGTGSVFLNGENAEIGFAATDEPFRGKGIQKALISARESFAKKNKCRFIFVETAEPTADHPAPSHRNMLRFGYTELYRRENHIYKF